MSIGASALAEEMEMNDVMRMQLMIMADLLTEDQRGRYAEHCRRVGIAADPPIPDARRIDGGAPCAVRDRPVAAPVGGDGG
jgi:hypothetical protein